MLRIQLGVEDLANTRFAISQLAETVFSLPAGRSPTRAGTRSISHGFARSRGRLDPDDEDLLRALVGPARIPHEYAGNPSRPVPDFLTPRPDRFAPRFEDELARARETTPSIVRRDLAAMYAPDPAPDSLRPRDTRSARGLLHAICDALERHWLLALQPEWEQMQLVLEADTIYRARRLATGGAQLLFADIHPNVRWHDGALSVAEMVSEGTIKAAGRGLLLLPSIFAYKPVPPLGPDEPPSLGYPSRGIGTLWEPTARAGLGGAGRAARSPADGAAGDAGRAAAHGRARQATARHAERRLPAPPRAPPHRARDRRARSPAGALPADAPRRTADRLGGTIGRRRP